MSLTGITRDELARRVALIHAQLWTADETPEDGRAALVAASDALGELAHDLGDDTDIACDLATVRDLAGGDATDVIDLRADRSLRTRVEVRLSEVLFDVLELRSESRSLRAPAISRP